MPQKMTNRMDALEAKVTVLEEYVKLSLVEFRQMLLLEITKRLDRHSSEEGNGMGGGGAPHLEEQEKKNEEEGRKTKI